MRKNSLLPVIAFSFILLVISCKQEGQPIDFNLSDEILISGSESYCPYLTKDHEGNPVLSFVSKTGEDSYIFNYAVSKDNGRSFENIISIPGSENIRPKEENIPKIIFTSNGEIIAAWTEPNPDEKHQFYDVIYYSISGDTGQNWSNPKRLVDEEQSNMQGYFDFSLLPNNEIGILWLDERLGSFKEGLGLYFAQTEGSPEFTNEKRIGAAACECCQTAMITDSRQNLHILYREIINDSIRDVVHFTSADSGNTFTESQRISDDNWVIYGCPHTGPSMTENNGSIDFTWFTAGSGEGIYYNRLKDGQYSRKENIAQGSNVMQCKITSFADYTALIWDEFNQNKQRLGLEFRNKEGLSIGKTHITYESEDTAYPVIIPLDENSVLTAYSKVQNNQGFVGYKIISVQ